VNYLSENTSGENSCWNGVDDGDVGDPLQSALNLFEALRILVAQSDVVD
jgi:hypothetical protein